MDQTDRITTKWQRYIYEFLGDVVGGGTAALAKGAGKLITRPKKTLAELAASFTPKDKLALQKDLIKDFEKAGLHADLGTLTDSNLVKWTQKLRSSNFCISFSQYIYFLF